ncbi:MAG TPA: phosphate ABC transporter permease PstA [Candidatus Nanopelagicaceae bacterium]|nr:phosphate ABC transporter permease PstA [Candidatus Nanopelagicaceae bacterium]
MAQSTSTQILDPSPGRPWQKSPRQFIPDLVVFVLALAVSEVTVSLTGLRGKIALLSLFTLYSMAGSMVIAFRRRGISAMGNALASSFVYLSVALVALPLFSVVITVISRGVHALRINTFTQDMAATQPDAPFNQGGALHAILGTIVLILLATAISVPIGVLTGLYLTEIKGRAEGLVRFLVQAMSGVPSIVAGLFVYAVWIVGGHGGFSGFSGAVALSILMLPTVARTAEEVLRLVPNDLREAGVALGGTQWRTVVMVVLPAARSGLITATVLGIARIAGETAPLLLTIFGTTAKHFNPFSGPMSALPLYVFQLLQSGLNVAIARAWTGSLVLLAMITVLFTFARVVGGKSKS